MNSLIYRIFALLACIGTLCSAQNKCYKCIVDTNPATSDCWLDPTNADPLEEEDCANSCYVEAFQSGGIKTSNDNFWMIKRGCAPEATCADSDNCMSTAWGTCRRCCTGDKCNIGAPNGSIIVKASLLVALSAAMLAKWLK